MEPKFEVSLKIRRPAAEVFDAVVRPERLSSYFVRTASGPLEEGSAVMWSFAEAPQPFEVKAREVKRPERIVLQWPGGQTYETTVEMTFKALDDANTLVTVREGPWREESGLQGPAGNAGGWMHMLCSLKARVEYDINLREGGAR
ncbi:MAG TPA: SRPBCC domain-containing protein [Caulobacteraceae bacterium]|nr:SRPBCC domain-containing protein [Caulobacteraceae bacterium]